jgi:hypothetical protein
MMPGPPRKQSMTRSENISAITRGKKFVGAWEKVETMATEMSLCPTYGKKTPHRSAGFKNLSRTIAASCVVA